MVPGLALAALRAVKCLVPHQRAALIRLLQLRGPRRGAITVQQLERLLARRAYHTRKEAWKEEQRRKNKAKNECGGAQVEVHGASFVYSAIDNRKDRTAAIMSAKSGASILLSSWPPTLRLGFFAPPPRWQTRSRREPSRLSRAVRRAPLVDPVRFPLQRSSSTGSVAKGWTFAPFASTTKMSWPRGPLRRFKRWRPGRSMTSRQDCPRPAA